MVGHFRAISSVGSEHLPYKQGVDGSNPPSPTRATESVLCTVLKSSVIQENPYASVGATEGPHVRKNMEELQIFYGSIYKTGSLLCGKRFVPMQYHPRLTTEDWNVLLQLWTDRRETFLLW